MQDNSLYVYPNEIPLVVLVNGWPRRYFMNESIFIATVCNQLLLLIDSGMNTKTTYTTSTTYIHE